MAKYSSGSSSSNGGSSASTGSSISSVEPTPSKKHTGKSTASASSQSTRSNREGLQKSKMELLIKSWPNTLSFPSEQRFRLVQEAHPHVFLKSDKSWRQASLVVSRWNKDPSIFNNFCRRYNLSRNVLTDDDIAACCSTGGSSNASRSKKNYNPPRTIATKSKNEKFTPKKTKGSSSTSFNRRGIPDIVQWEDVDLKDAVTIPVDLDNPGKNREFLILTTEMVPVQTKELGKQVHTSVIVFLPAHKGDILRKLYKAHIVKDGTALAIEAPQLPHWFLDEFESIKEGLKENRDWHEEYSVQHDVHQGEEEVMRTNTFLLDFKEPLKQFDDLVGITNHVDTGLMADWRYETDQGEEEQSQMIYWQLTLVNRIKEAGKGKQTIAPTGAHDKLLQKLQEMSLTSKKKAAKKQKKKSKSKQNEDISMEESEEEEDEELNEMMSRYKEMMKMKKEKKDKRKERLKQKMMKLHAELQEEEEQDEFEEEEEQDEEQFFGPSAAPQDFNEQENKFLTEAQEVSVSQEATDFQFKTGTDSAFDANSVATAKTTSSQTRRQIKRNTTKEDSRGLLLDEQTAQRERRRSKRLSLIRRRETLKVGVDEKNRDERSEASTNDGSQNQDGMASVSAAAKVQGEEGSVSGNKERRPVFEICFPFDVSWESSNEEIDFL